MPQLKKSALKARNTLLAMSLVHLALDTTLVVISNDLWAIIRILVAAAVMYFVFQGYRWAKWVAIAILSFLVVALMALVTLLYAKLSTVLIAGSCILALLSATMTLYIAFSQNLNRYFSAKRKFSYL